MEYIRKTYNVPAKRGARIEFTGDSLAKFIYGFLYKGKKGTIVAARGGYIRVRFDGQIDIKTLHPTWEVRYL
jgi:hypothetical protein